MTSPMKVPWVARSAVEAPHTGVHRVVRRFMEPAQDLLVLAVATAVFALMARTLAGLFTELFAAVLNFRVVIAEVLFILVLVEVVRLLIIYLQEHRVAVDFMVELGIVATLREVVLRGAIELDWGHIVALSGFLLTLGALLRFGDLRALEPPAAHGGHAPRAIGEHVDTRPGRTDQPIQSPDVRVHDRADAER
jgi:uncharacterized membrane protein (DUF373 family)